MRWLKKLLTGRKEGHKGHKENQVASDWRDGTEREKERWSFVKQRKSGVDSGRRPSEAAAAEPSQVRPCHCGEEEDARAREEKAAVVIQKAFRGYLARKALRALRALVKLQALVRGYLVRKQAATTLHRLQALMRLQADSYVVKRASYRKSMEQERIITQEARVKQSATPAHRRRLSDGTNSNYERSPRIVEMDTCHLRSRSTRIVSSRYTPDHPSGRLTPVLAPSCSPLSSKQPPRLSIQRCRERDPRQAKTSQNTPRCFVPARLYESPAKSVDGLTSRRLSHRDVIVSPRYMEDTASSAARTQCQSAPRQRQAEAPPRVSLTRSGSRKSCSQMHDSAFCFPCSVATQTGCSELSHEAARDYYLDRMW